MEGSIKFSVCIPVYNVEHYLEACVESVLNQTYQNFEIILVDDGSPDKSGEICDRLAASDKRIKVFHKPNEGQLSARSAAVNRAIGDFIVFLDSDDTLDSKALETIYHAISEYNVDCIIYDYQRVGVDIPFENSKKKSSFLLLESTPKLLKFVLSSEKYNSLCIKCFKRSAFTDIDYKQYYSIRHGEDLIQSIDLILKCNSGVAIPDVLYYYTYNPNSVSNAPNWLAQEINYTVNELALEKAIELNIFSDEEMVKYQEYCVGKLLTQINAIAKSSVIKEEKIKLFNQIRESNYYQSFLANPLGNLTGLGLKKHIYCLFRNKNDGFMLFLLKIVSWLRRKK